MKLDLHDNLKLSMNLFLFFCAQLKMCMQYIFYNIDRCVISLHPKPSLVVFRSEVWATAIAVVTIRFSRDILLSLLDSYELIMNEEF
mmetsp:Transcript_13447/g.27822  ORF Transcript_13447/g.27822 Transcript_13447/m.27822 type:complete len:87 (+) Transcript_13447:41-301(+)